MQVLFWPSQFPPAEVMAAVEAASAAGDVPVIAVKGVRTMLDSRTGELQLSTTQRAVLGVPAPDVAEQLRVACAVQLASTGVVTVRGVAHCSNVSQLGVAYACSHCGAAPQCTTHRVCGVCHQALEMDNPLRRLGLVISVCGGADQTMIVEQASHVKVRGRLHALGFEKLCRVTVKRLVLRRVGVAHVFATAF